MDHPFTRRFLTVGLGALLLLLVVLPACSDDPILGPSDGTPQEGGSYSALDRLAPPASAVDSSRSSAAKQVRPLTNPERF